MDSCYFDSRTRKWYGLATFVLDGKTINVLTGIQASPQPVNDQGFWSLTTVVSFPRINDIRGGIRLEE